MNTDISNTGLKETRNLPESPEGTALNRNMRHYYHTHLTLPCLLAGISVIVSALLFITCSTLTQTAGTGSETETGQHFSSGLYGYLVDGRDGQRAKGALVVLYSADSMPLTSGLIKIRNSAAASLDTSLTDSNGLYLFDSLQAGTYNVYAQYIDASDTLYALKSGIEYDSVAYAGIDTLRLPGSIRGSVSIINNERTGIMCYIPGTSYLAMTDSLGDFTITNVPPGTHNLAFMHSIFNDTVISGIVVLSNAVVIVPPVLLHIDANQNERDLWGVFEVHTDNIGRIKAIVTGDSIPTDTPRVFDLAWNPDFQGYSGFIYVPKNGHFWKATVVVFDSAGHKTGQKEVVFNRTTGDIAVPVFDPWNAKPIVFAGHDTTLSIKDSLLLHAVAADSIGGAIVNWAWAIGNTSSHFIQVSSGDTTIVLPALPDSNYRCIIRVIDSDGNMAMDSITIHNRLFPPVLNAISNLNFSQIRPAAITVSAHDSNLNGRIEKYYWNTGTNGLNDSSNMPACTVSCPNGGQVSLVWGVRDDDGNIARDTAIIHFNRIPGKPSLSGISNGDTARFSAFDYINKKGTVALHGMASDPDGVTDTLTYSLFLGANSATMSRIYLGKDSIFQKNQLDTAKAYHWRLVVTDLFGDSSQDTGYFYTPPVSLPVKPIILAAHMAADSTIHLSWAKATSATVYKVYQKILGNSMYDSIGTSPDTFFVGEKLLLNIKYLYRIKASTKWGDSPFSDSVKIITVAPASSNIDDNVLIAYHLAANQEALFSVTDGKISDFWNRWDTLNATALTVDYIEMGSDDARYAWNRCGTSPFVGSDDARITVKAAYTDNGAYFLLDVTDNSWVEYSGWSTDVAELYFDVMNATEIADPLNWFNPSQWALTFSSKQIQVGMGNQEAITQYDYRFYDDLAMSITDHAVNFGDAAYDGITMEIIKLSDTRKVQEWFIPWTQWGVNKPILQGKRYSFIAGYHDVDADVADCPNSLRWQGLCDPYCNPPNPSVWGDIELGNQLP